jgi:hypothetical protein
LTNLEDFLKANMTCKGIKGCFMTNTYLDFSIIPQKVRAFIKQNDVVINDPILKNVKAAGVKKSPSNDHQ